MDGNGVGTTEGDILGLTVGSIETVGAAVGGTYEYTFSNLYINPSSATA